MLAQVHRRPSVKPSFRRDTIQGRRVIYVAPAVHRFVAVCWFSHPSCSARPSTRAAQHGEWPAITLIDTWVDRCLRPAAQETQITTQLPCAGGTLAHDRLTIHAPASNRPNTTRQEGTTHRAIMIKLRISLGRIGAFSIVMFIQAQRYAIALCKLSQKP